MQTKKCSKCGIDKPLTSDNYYKNPFSSTGFKSSCKECFKTSNNYQPIPYTDEEAPRQACTKCGEAKPMNTNWFYRERINPSGLRHICKKCSNNPPPKPPPQTKEERDRKAKAHRSTPKYKEREKARILANIERVREIKRSYKLRHPDRIKEQNKRYIPSKATLEKRKKRSKEKWRQYRLKNPIAPRVKKPKKKYPRYPDNPERKKIWEKKYYIKAMADPVRKLKIRLRCRIRYSVQGKLEVRTNEYIKFTAEELMTHLESLWLPGMSWENYGKKGWEIDHIKPCASFDMSVPEQVKECWLLSNLQPLWGIDNNKKGAKYGGVNYNPRSKKAA